MIWGRRHGAGKDRLAPDVLILKSFFAESSTVPGDGASSSGLLPPDRPPPSCLLPLDRPSTWCLLPPDRPPPCCLLPPAWPLSWCLLPPVRPPPRVSCCLVYSLWLPGLPLCLGCSLRLPSVLSTQFASCGFMALQFPGLPIMSSRDSFYPVFLGVSLPGFLTETSWVYFCLICELRCPLFIPAWLNMSSVACSWLFLKHECVWLSLGFLFPHSVVLDFFLPGLSWVTGFPIC